MKGSTVALIAGGGIALYLLAQFTTAGATVQFVFQGFNFLSPTQLQVNILVQNVSNAAINFNAMSGTMSINGNSLGNVSYFPPTPAVIQPTSQLIIPFSVSLNLLTLPSTILNLYNNVSGSGAYVFNITGNANINTLVIPFNLNYTTTL